MAQPRATSAKDKLSPESSESSFSYSSSVSSSRETAELASPFVSNPSIPSIPAQPLAKPAPPAVPLPVPDVSPSCDVIFTDKANRYVTIVDPISGVNGDEEEGICDKCCGDRSIELLCWRVPVINIRLVPFLVWNVTLCLLLVIFGTKYGKVKLNEVTLLQYWKLGIAMVDSLYALDLAFYWFSILLRALCFRAWKPFLIGTEVAAEISVVVWAFLFYMIYPLFIVGAKPATLESWRVAMGALLLFGCAKFARAVLYRTVMSLRGKHFYTVRMHDSLFREAILTRLLQAPKRSPSRAKLSDMSTSSDDEETPVGPSIKPATAPVQPLNQRTTAFASQHKMIKGKGCCRATAMKTAGAHYNTLADSIIKDERMRFTVQINPGTNADNIKAWALKAVDPDYPASPVARGDASVFLAKQLFNKLKPRKNSKYLRPADIEHYFNDETKASMAFLVFDKNSKGRVTEAELIDAVKDIFNDRWDLAVRLRSRKSLQGVLQKFLTVILGVLSFILLFVIMRVNFALLLPYLTIILGMSFVFGEMVKNTFNSFVFIFFINPYDVGDLIVVEGTFATVASITLITTKFSYQDGRKMVQFNSALLGKAIPNCTRSATYGFQVKVLIDGTTAPDKIALFRKRVTEWPTVDKNFSRVLLWASDFERSSNMIFNLYAYTKGTTWGRLDLCMGIMCDFVVGINALLREIGVEGSLAPQPVHLFGDLEVARKEKSKKKKAHSKDSRLDDDSNFN